MEKRNRMEGGFAWLNSSEGRLENCYAAVRINKRKRENAGFIYDNRGTVSHCFTRSRTSRWKQNRQGDGKKKDGFCSFNSGTIHKSFFLEKKEKHLKDYRDSAMGLAVKDADCPLLQERFDWDLSIFEEENAAKMDFLSENWHYELPEQAAEMENRTLIRTEKELTDIIDSINRGSQSAACGWYELAADLNFHGRELTPIGCDAVHPFEGVFDGNGHTIRGFVLKGKDRPALGLFGYLKGTVANLRTDGIVKGKNCRMAASFCGINEGEIHCCEAVFEIQAKYNTGMFAGENHGLIERCSIDGKSRGVFFALLPLFPLLPLLALALLLALNPPKPSPDYEPIPEDHSIVPNPENNTGKRSNENKASYEVPKILEADADTLTVSDKRYVIKNPNRKANYDFVAVITMTDSHGNPVEVYKSGRIPTGYHITSLTLKPPKGIRLSKGSYDAQIAFAFYHKDTGEKGMVDSTVPIQIKIK